MTPSKQEFVEILKTHRALLYKIISLYARDAEDRRDLEQEIAIQIWRSMSAYDSGRRLSTWIYRVALNAAISHLRKESRHKDQLVPFCESMFALTQDDSQSELDSERSTMLHAFIRELDPFNKALMILYLEEKSYKEIAHTLGISESNVGTKISRIKNRLREKFKVSTDQ